MPKSKQNLDDFLTRIDKVHEAFHEHSLSDAKNFAEIKAGLHELTAAFKTHQIEMKQYMTQVEPRMRALEDFRTTAMAKLSVIVALAITIGSFLGQLALTGLHKLIFKQ